MPRKVSGSSSRAGETLYNGIVLPHPWPPRLESLSREPMPVPYLANPPAVIPVDVGRQLFVDDFLVESTDLTRTFHLPAPHPDNPVLRPDRPWEWTAKGEALAAPREHAGAYAMPFSDGVWYDPQDRLVKLWYFASSPSRTCHAVSSNGIHWEKPSLDVVAGTNIVHGRWRDSATIWLDHNEPDSASRFKMFWFDPSDHTFVYQASPDGVHWGEVLCRSSLPGDRSTVFYNPFRRKWVASIRSAWAGMGRTRRYREADIASDALAWKDAEAEPLWCGSDLLDPRHGDYDFQPDLYNLDAVAYESLMLGFFSVHQGEARQDIGRPKRNEVFIGFSRDGFHWHRPVRRPFIGVSDRKGDWNWGNVQSAGGGCLVMGDQLYFYHSGRAGNGKSPKDRDFWDSDGATGLAVLRRDGFASMDAGDGEGYLLTRPLRFSGRRLFVNADVAGQLRVEVLDEQRRAISGLTEDACLPVQGDGTCQAVSWTGGKDLSGVSGRPVRLRFHLTRGRLFSFWVSADPRGASNGYVAGGGPGFTGPTDTVGRGPR